MVGNQYSLLTVVFCESLSTATSVRLTPTRCRVCHVRGACIVPSAPYSASMSESRNLPNATQFPSNIMLQRFSTSLMGLRALVCSRRRHGQVPHHLHVRETSPYGSPSCSGPSLTACRFLWGIVVLSQAFLKNWSQFMAMVWPCLESGTEPHTDSTTLALPPRDV